MTTTDEEEYVSAEEYSSVLRDYQRVVEESDGFDIEKVSIPPSMYGMITGLMPVNCSTFYAFRELVKLYCMVGLHRYNMLEGTNLQLASLVKFNMTQNCLSSYFITLLAHDPAAGPLDKTFQVQINEQKFGNLDLTSSIARPKDEVTTKTPFIPHFHGEDELPDWLSDDALNDGKRFKGELPDWPSDDALNDGKRFYVVKESEWQANDWISMYLELVLYSHSKSISHNRDVVSQLQIVKVAIETAIEDVEPPKERLKAKSAHVYITFKGLAEPRAPLRVFEKGEHVERKAIVRRVIDEHTGYLTLVGNLCGGTKKRSLVGVKTESCEKRARLG